MKAYFFFLILIPFGLSGQCDLDRHNTSAETGWKSCTTSANPNTIRADGHWIMYDFTFEYSLEQVHIWNHNHPESLSEGIKDITLDVSLDGVSWTQVASYVVPQGTGSAGYDGVDGPLLNARARYLLLTAQSNYGGSCTAMGELRVGVADEIDCQNYDVLAGDLGHKKYFATDYINTDGFVNNDKVVHFQAGTEVNIAEGFEARSNTEFLIDIQPCNN